MKVSSPLLAALTGLLLLLAPASAVAQNPLTIPQAPTPAPTVPTTTSATTADTSSAGRGLSKNEEALIFGIAIVLIGSIVYVIRRDARTHAPNASASDRGGGRATVPPLAKRVERNRAKAKAARRQRKRSR
ncbi:MAG TPA: hypothetical protein VG165_06750 [Solirubrobacteraceae bacterium]|nr:hypothetical protein [Solirubrobacteraceae bacterium]